MTEQDIKIELLRMEAEKVRIENAEKERLIEVEKARTVAKYKLYKNITEMLDVLSIFGMFMCVVVGIFSMLGQGLYLKGCIICFITMLLILFISQCLSYKRVLYKELSENK